MPGRRFETGGYRSERYCVVGGSCGPPSVPWGGLRAEFRLAAATFISSVCCMSCACSSLNRVSNEWCFKSDRAWKCAASQNNPASAKNFLPDTSTSGVKDRIPPDITKVPKVIDRRKLAILEEILPQPSIARFGKSNDKARFILAQHGTFAVADSMAIAFGERWLGRGYRQITQPH